MTTWAPTVVGICLADVAPETVRWRSHGRLAHGKLTILDGDPGLGKSTLAMDWAARITTGRPLPDGPADRPRGVILISAEDDIADTIRPRMDAAGADPRRVLVLNELPGPTGNRLFELPTDVGVLEETVRAYDAALVVIDPFMGFLAENIKANHDQDVRRALGPLALAMQRTGASCLLVRHLNKSGSDNALYRGGGSIGIIGVARFGLLVAADPEEPEARVLASTKCNLSRPPPNVRFRLVGDATTETARIEMLGGSGYTTGELLSASADGEERAERDECREWLRALLAEGPMPSTQAQREARNAGFGERALKRAKLALRVQAQRVGFGKEGQWVWNLPIEGREATIEGHPPTIEGHHQEAHETVKTDIEGHRRTVNGYAREEVPRGSGVYVCLGCGLPRSRGPEPCPSCGATTGAER